MTFGLTGTAAPAAAQIGPAGHARSAPVEPALLDQLAEQSEATFWVVLDQQADLTTAAAVEGWEARGSQVYDTLTTTAEQSQAGLAALLSDRGADHQSFWIVNAIKVTGDRALVDELAGRPEVGEILADRTYQIPQPRPALAPPGTQAVEWGVDRIGAPDVWDTFDVRGEGIVVGLTDTGAFFNHPALVEKYRGNNGDGTFDHNYNWHDPSNVCGAPSLTPCDNNGHGTHVVGTMVGDDGGTNQVGVAPAARWIVAKGCETNNCSTGALLSSGQFMLAPTDLAGQNPRTDLRPHIVNNSWGGGNDTDPWYQGIVRSWVAAGIFPQFSNGNTQGSAPCASTGNPGNLPESYAAGAFDINNNIAAFSNRGPSAWDGIIKPNISAPGVAVRSSWNNGSYQVISGTSMASPHVAGTVALIWSAVPALAGDIEATRELLDDTAIDVENLTCGGTPENNNVWGQGRLDAFAAVSQALGVEEDPAIEVSPDVLSAEQPAGTVTEQPLSISNVGDGSLDWSIGEAEPATGGDDPARTVPAEVPAATGQQVPAADVILDGGFEAGAPNPFWDEGSTNFGTPLCTIALCDSGGGTGPRGGSWWAWFGGIDAAETGFVRQQVTLDPGVAELRFWLEIPAASGTGQDFLRVSIDDSEVFSVTDADAPDFPSYTEVTVDVSDFADGGTHTLSFDSSVFGGGTTNFFVDDVLLDVQAPAGPCDTPGDVPWLAVSPDSGSTGAGETSDVTVSFDSAGLAPGEVEALLCVASNDPATPLVQVPVSLTVVEDPGGTVCDRTIAGVHDGPLTVESGTTCLAAGSQVLGEVNVSAGAGLMATAAVIQGPVSAIGAAHVDLTFTQVTGPVLVFGATDRVSLFASQVTGSVSLLNGVTVDPTAVSGNTIIGTLSCFGNQPAPTDHGLSNTATGGKLGQCTEL
ncbi:MAG: S8 family serine peptidase [Natronosporangium sp.]